MSGRACTDGTPPFSTAADHLAPPFLAIPSRSRHLPPSMPPSRHHRCRCLPSRPTGGILPRREGGEAAAAGGGSRGRAATRRVERRGGGRDGNLCPHSSALPARTVGGVFSTTVSPRPAPAWGWCGGSVGLSGRGVATARRKRRAGGASGRDRRGAAVALRLGRQRSKPARRRGRPTAPPPRPLLLP